MKRIIFFFIFGALAFPAFSQCTFESTTKVRKDQYSKSSQTNIKDSQNAMDKQQTAFQKPHYQADLKMAPKKRKDRSQY
jgi:hypothetical protein